MAFRPAFQYFNNVLADNGQFATYWQKALTDLLNRIVSVKGSWTGNVSFSGIAAQHSSDFVVQFPTGSVPQGTSCVAMSSPKPPANSSFTAHVDTGDKVVIRFNNYSSGSLSVSSSQFSLMILPKG